MKNVRGRETLTQNKKGNKVTKTEEVVTFKNEKVAKEHYTIFIENNPDSDNLPYAYNNRGLIFKAQKDYEDLIKSCRQGVNLTLEEIHSINETITPLVKKGQTTNHLYINHPDILDFSKSSFYHYIKDGIFEFGL